MGLETGTYISSLNSSNPVTGDNKTEGDDHLRLIKATILATFPNVTGAMTATHGELNRLAGQGAAATGFFAACNGGDLTSGNTCLFAEIVDHGNCYSAATGKFTVPVTGDYLVAFTVGTQNLTGSSGTLAPRLIISGVSSSYYAQPTATVPASAFGFVSWSGILTLTAAVTLEVYAGLGTAISSNFVWAGDYRSTFSARLLA